MSTGINIAPSSDLTVGTTAVTSGTDGRVFFQAGGVVQQDANFTYDNTLKRLGLKAVGTAATDIPFNIQNSAGTVNLLQQNGVGSILARSNDTFSYAGLFYRSDGTNGWSLTNSHSGYGQGTGIETVGGSNYILSSGTRALSIQRQSTGTFKTYGIWNYGSDAGQRLLIGENVFDPQLTLSGTGNLGIGTYTAGARLDVKAQGALSTDIAFRVRNSADTADIFSIRGNNNIYLAEGTFNGSNTIFHGSTSLLQYSHNANSSIALGQGAAFTNATNYNTIVGASSTTGATVGFGIALGYSVFVTATGAIGIGDRARAGGVNSIRIGNSDGGSSAYTGTNSIHLGKTISGNSITADDVLMTYFNSQSSSTLTRANGSFGLLGQQSYIIGNGGGTYGIETFMGNGGNTLVVTNHPSVPSTNILNTFQLYSNDITAGNAAPHFRTENGSIVKLYQETTGVAAATLVGGGGTTITDTDTFGGYTLQQIAQALKNLGILA